MAARKPIATSKVIVMDAGFTDSNPNGDPDADGMIRQNPTTGQAYISHPRFKRWVRDAVEFLDDQGAIGGEEDEDGNQIFIVQGAVLNDIIAECSEKAKKEYGSTKGLKEWEVGAIVRDYMNRKFFDLRTFGGVLSTGDKKCGTVTGAAQVLYARSIDPVEPESIAITRCAATKEEKRPDGKMKENKTMGRQWRVDYARFKIVVFVSAIRAQETGFSDEDFDLLVKIIRSMFEMVHTDALGLAVMHGVYVFDYPTMVGSCSAAELADLVKIEKICEDEPTGPQDYRVEFDPASVPEGIKVSEYHTPVPFC